MRRFDEGPLAHPGWFGAVMASAVLSIVVLQESRLQAWTWLAHVAFAILVIATVASALLLPGYVRRVLRRDDLKREIADPVRGPLLATLPAGLLLLAAAWGTVGPVGVPEGAGIAVDAVLATVGALGALAYSLAWNTSPIRGAGGLQGVNGGWLIPPTSLALVAIALAPIAGYVDDWGRALLATGLLFLGAGTVMSFAVFALLVARVALHPEIPAALAPSMWIPLAPAAVIGIASVRLAQSAEQHGIVPSAVVSGAGIVAALGLGLGLWWAAFAAWDLRRIRRNEPIAFQPGWWAFLFPPSAMVLSFQMLVLDFGRGHLVWLTMTCSVLLLALWAYVMTRSIRLVLAPAHA